MNLGNLLNMALNVLPKQTVQWYQSLPSQPSANGNLVPAFAAPAPVTGSFQAVAKSSYQQLGLDMNRTYVTFFASFAIHPLARNIAGDEFVFAGDRYHVLSNTEWINVNGWNENMAVKITP